MIKLREILSMPVFRNFRVVAGEGGIDREVGTVSVMDAPDIYKWMKGGEFLITTGYAVKDRPEYIRSLIINLDKGGAAALGMSPLQGDLNALIASCSEYTFRTQGKRMDGTMYSCTSLGVKIGGGIGVALAGWLLEASGYIANAPVQADSCISMLYFMYLWIPMGINILITVLLSRLKVEQANEALR